MHLSTFLQKSDLLTKPELEKVKLLAFYFLKTESISEFNISRVNSWFTDINLPRPHSTRLKEKLARSRSFTKGQSKSHYRLHANEIQLLEGQYPELNERSEEIVCSDTILPESVYQNTGRAYIDSLARQINAAYEHNIFDGCAVLMRRLLEVLLIHTYQHLEMESDIQDANGTYLSLDRIIGKAQTNNTLGLSRNTKENLGTFRTLGNFSAHKIHYIARRADIGNHSLEYRAIIEELLAKASLKT